MSYLRKQGKFATASRPDLILLDLNMPRKDGRQVLREMDSDPGLRGIPVIILTTSAAPRDVQDAYELCANSYISKPPSFAAFQAAIEELDRYWFGTALIP
jgi:CheY-like chemotaxis protein